MKGGVRFRVQVFILLFQPDSSHPKTPTYDARSFSHNWQRAGCASRRRKEYGAKPSPTHATQMRHSAHFLPCHSVDSLAIRSQYAVNLSVFVVCSLPVRYVPGASQIRRRGDGCARVTDGVRSCLR